MRSLSVVFSYYIVDFSNSSLTSSCTFTWLFTLVDLVERSCWREGNRLASVLKDTDKRGFVLAMTVSLIMLIADAGCWKGKNVVSLVSDLIIVEGDQRLHTRSPLVESGVLTSGRLSPRNGIFAFLDGIIVMVRWVTLAKGRIRSHLVTDSPTQTYKRGGHVIALLTCSYPKRILLLVAVGNFSGHVPGRRSLKVRGKPVKSSTKHTIPTSSSRISRIYK